MIFKNIEMCIRDRGYVERMPDQAGLTNRGRLVIRLTAQKDSVSAAESEQQASTGDPANMRENTQENTQQEVGLADASYFGDNRLYRRKKDSQDTWELLTDGGSGFGTEQTEDDEAGYTNPVTLGYIFVAFQV